MAAGAVDALPWILELGPVLAGLEASERTGEGLAAFLGVVDVEHGGKSVLGCVGPPNQAREPGPEENELSIAGKHVGTARTFLKFPLNPTLHSGWKGAGLPIFEPKRRASGKSSILIQRISSI